MFRRRADGRIAKDIPNFDKIIPYIMVRRYDAQNFVTQSIPHKPIKSYVNAKKAEGADMSLMSVILAAYVRTAAERPEINRFVMNRRIYARNSICVSFVVLRREGETAGKITFDGAETVFQVAQKVNACITAARKEEESNAVDKLLGAIFAMPLVPSAIVSILKWLDRHNMMPKSVIEASPFHTGMFFTNLASIRMPPAYHHLYEFGTTSIFTALGTPYKKLELDPDGKPVEVEYCPLNASLDDRICTGAAYARAFLTFRKYIMRPELLETPGTAQ
ncbi:MAG: 2-oxoglutarate dehydrogenase [Clostridia bacterium]|nr:2-oxoglutarate dehydrogenase [Clostridia bacterium]